MKRALITGIAGFAGSYLAEELVRAGWAVTGIERAGAPLSNLDGLGGKVSVAECDITVHGEVVRALREARPDAVFHLAAVTFVPSAEGAPRAAFDVNVAGSLNVLEGCRSESPGARVILVSSAEVYGIARPEEMPLAEDRSPEPASIYALTKVCAEEAAFYYSRAHSLDCVVLRPFNHIGPRQSHSFVTSAFARQIAEIEVGLREPVIDVGNLDAARDFTDVRDVARAYRLAAERCVAGLAYNVCTGRAHVIGEVLKELLRMSRKAIEVRRVGDRLRRADIPLRLGDHSRFTAATGWEPGYGIDRTLRDILEYWRGRIGEGETA